MPPTVTTSPCTLDVIGGDTGAHNDDSVPHGDCPMLGRIWSQGNMTSYVFSTTVTYLILFSAKDLLARGQHVKRGVIMDGEDSEK